MTNTVMDKSKKIIFIFLLLSVFYLITSPYTVSASSATDFQAGRIIDDSVFTNSNYMSKDAIQNFLNSKVSSCDTNGTLPASEYGRPDLTHAQYAAAYGWSAPPYTCLKDYYENGKSAAQIIYDISQQYTINPAVLIVLLQKEQGLVTDTWPLASQYKTATGYGCPDTAACDSQYYGFTNQVTWSNIMFRSIMNDSSTWYTPYLLGNNYIQWSPNSSCGGTNVYIQNRATKALYNYTPYQPNQAALNAGYGIGDSCSAYGNRNFYLYFGDWFGNTTVTQSDIYIPNGTYSIINPISSKAIDVSYGSSSDGARIWMYEQNNTKAQEWQITRADDGFYIIKNIGSGKYLDVIGAGSVAGTGIQIWPGNSGCAQRWSAVSVNNNVSFVNKCSGLALDIFGGSTANTTPLQIYQINRTTSQSWRLINKDTPILSNGFYKINSTSGLSVGVGGDGVTSGSRIKILDNIASPNEYWQLKRTTDGTYTVRNPKTGKYLDVVSEGIISGTPIQLWVSNTTSCAQKWQITKVNDNYSFISKCSGLALDVVSGAISTPDTSLQLYDNNQTVAQQWQLSELAFIPDGDYSIRSISNLAIDIINGNVADGSKLQIWSANHTNAQRWTITSIGDNKYTIKNPSANKYIDLPGANTVLSSNTQIYTGNNTCAQKWQITIKNNPYSKIESSCSTNVALDIIGGQYMKIGTKIQNYTSNNSNAQTWFFDEP